MNLNKHIVEYSSIGLISIRSDNSMIRLSKLEIPARELGKLSKVDEFWETMFEIGCYIVRNEGGN